MNLHTFAVSVFQSTHDFTVLISNVSNIMIFWFLDPPYQVKEVLVLKPFENVFDFVESDQFHAASARSSVYSPDSSQKLCMDI